jgi:hypothetical protein
MPAGSVIAAGHAHSGAVTAGGRLFVWGEGRSGRLGVGPGVPAAPLPTEVVAPGWERGVAQVACGHAHTVAVTADGACYAWGFGRYGATGSGGDEDALVPQRVALRERVASAACGYYHSAAVTEAGTLYVWGAGDDGQLGTGDREHRLAPTAMRLGTDTDAPRAVEMVCCGMSHTVAVTRGGELWACGEHDAAEGSEGAGVARLVWPVDSSVPVVRAACGFHHTLVLTSSGEVCVMRAAHVCALFMLPALSPPLAHAHCCSCACEPAHARRVQRTLRKLISHA